MADTTEGLTIKAVAERTGVSEYTLRAWERRYGIPQPARDAGNRYRAYSEQDIADVLRLKRQIEQGLKPALAGTLLRQQRTQRRSRARRKIGAPVAELRANLGIALARADGTAALEVLDQAAAHAAPEQFADAIIAPTMETLGTRWQEGTLAVWEEHLASNLIRQRLLAMMQALPPPTEPTLALAAACAPEEQHEIGLLLFALLLRREGWRVTYLGQRTPLDNLVPLVHTQRIALSVSTVAGLSGLIPLLAEQDLPRARIFFGGSLANELPRLREHLPGVFAGTTAAEGVRVLTTSEPPPNRWTPPKKNLRYARLLQSERLSIAAETMYGLARDRGHKPATGAEVLTAPTLFLLDALASALAFDVPELLEQQVFWVKQALPPRGVGAPFLAAYVESVRRALEQHLEADAARPISGMLDGFQLDAAPPNWEGN